MLTKDGLTIVPSLSSFIGKEASSSIEVIIEKLHYKKVMDCIGIKGFRNITLVGSERHIDVVCKTDSFEEVINESIAPHEAEWKIIDIFEYIDMPKSKKGFY